MADTVEVTNVSQTVAVRRGDTTLDPTDEETETTTFDVALDSGFA